MKVTRRSLLLSSVVLGVAGCSRPAETPTPSPTQAPTTPSVAPTPSPSPSPTPALRAPLTGLPATDPAALTRPAVAVKVPNLKVEQPQLGLNEADIVICAPNGDSSTRLCPIFHSRFAEAVGPVRSMRPADVPLLSPIFPVLGNTGASSWVNNYIEAHSERLEVMTYLDFKKTGAYSVDKARLYTAGGRTQYDRAIQAHPAKMAEIAEKAGAPGPYLTFALDAASSSAAGGAAATRVVIPYGPAHKYDMSYDYDEASGRYLRSQPWGEHVLADGTRVDVDSVLIVKAKWEYGKIWKGKGDPDPVIELIDAEGQFLYVHGGTSVAGTWRKGAIAEPFVFTTDAGAPLLVAPGRTWIELPRPTADVTLS